MWLNSNDLLTCEPYTGNDYSVLICSPTCLGLSSNKNDYEQVSILVHIERH